jgi:5-methylcytosine-specific restriction endonuclease McrA
MRYQWNRPLSPVLYAMVLAQDGLCVYCGHQMRPMPDGGGTTPTRDHVIPLSRGGPDLLTNLAAACYECNFVKDDMLLDVFLRTKWLLQRRMGPVVDEAPPVAQRRDWRPEPDDPLWACRR